MSSKSQSSKIKPFKSNFFLIPVEVQKEMSKMIKSTHDTNREHGTSLCVERGTNKVVIGKKSVGTEAGIIVPEDCRKKNHKYIGSFHTHPDGSEALASAQDIFSSCLKISNLDCVGKNEIGEIVCYEKKDKNTSCVKDAIPLKAVEDIFYEIPEEQLPSVKEGLYAEVDRLADKKFDVHVVK